MNVSFCTMEGLCEHCNEKVSAGLTEALCTAVRRGHVDCGKVLIAAGADVNGRDPDGSTPFSLVGICEPAPVYRNAY